MKNDVTYIDAAKFEEIIVASGLPMTEQKGFVKVQGPTGRCVYVARTKRVGRVDISGFRMWNDETDSAIPGYVTPHCGEFGNVRQQLDFSLDEVTILENFRDLLAGMQLLEPVEKKQRKAPAEKADAPKGWSAKEERKELIASRAKKAKPESFETKA